MDASQPPQNTIAGVTQNPQVVNAPQTPPLQAGMGAGAVHTADVHHIEDVNELFDGVPETKHVDAMFHSFGGR